MGRSCTGPHFPFWPAVQRFTMCDKKNLSYLKKKLNAAVVKQLDIVTDTEAQQQKHHLSPDPLLHNSMTPVQSPFFTVNVADGFILNVQVRQQSALVIGINTLCCPNSRKLHCCVVRRRSIK